MAGAGMPGMGGGDLLSAGLSAANPLLGEGMEMGMQLLTSLAGGGGDQGGASGKPGEDVHPTLDRFNG
ncbi:hypothetical protein SAMN03159318_03572 [Pseudomonas sp. NFACC42-2]|jgi:hypothetical protein|nr:hypothetical protein SAMN03159318_03572 [Pseudomonas sp. NFACC42-2]